MAPHQANPAYDDQNPPPAKRHKGIFKNIEFPMGPSFNEKNLSDKPFFMRNDPLIDVPTVAKHYIDRQETLQSVDDLVEQVYLALKDTGKLDNTYIIFTSDNGYFNGEHRRSFVKNLVYEESIRVPLVIYGPKVPVGINRSEMVTNVDVTATIVELAGAKSKRTMNGKSLTTLFTKKYYVPWRTAFIVEGLDQDGVNRKLFPGRYKAVRTNDLKYILHTSGEEELYNLSIDPLEMQSLDKDIEYGQVKNSLNLLLNSLKTCSGENCWYTTPFGVVGNLYLNLKKNLRLDQFDLIL